VSFNCVFDEVGDIVDFFPRPLPFNNRLVAKSLSEKYYKTLCIIFNEVFMEIVSKLKILVLIPNNVL
jgi:hypothetical protein